MNLKLDCACKVLRILGMWPAFSRCGCHADCSQAVDQSHLDGFRKCLIFNLRVHKSFPAKVLMKVEYLVVVVVAMVSCQESSLCGNSFLEYFSLSLKMSFPLFFVPLYIENDLIIFKIPT